MTADAFQGNVSVLCLGRPPAGPAHEHGYQPRRLAGGASAFPVSPTPRVRLDRLPTWPSKKVDSHNPWNAASGVYGHALGQRHDGARLVQPNFTTQQGSDCKNCPGGIRLFLKAKIVSRIERLGLGNPGDVKPVGAGVSEMRVPYGPGYRVYFKQTGKTVIVLLCGGDKSTQEKDIKRAQEIAAEL